MALQHAYAVTNLFSGLGAAAITPSAGSSTNETRLVDGYVDRRWDAGSVASGLDLDFDAGSNIFPSAIALLNHNCDGQSVTCEVINGSDAAFSAPTTKKSASTLHGKDSVLQLAGGGAQRRYWRLRFAWSGSFSLKLGEVFACSKTTLTRAIVYGNKVPRRIEATHNRTRTGRQFGNFIAGPIGGRELVWEDLSESELEEVQAMFDAAQGPGKDLLWIDQVEATVDAATEATQKCAFGRFQDMDIEGVNTDFGRFSGVTLSLVEQGRGIGL